MKQKYGVFRSGGPSSDVNVLHKTAGTKDDAARVLDGLVRDEAVLNEGYGYRIAIVPIDAIGQYDSDRFVCEADQRDSKDELKPCPFCGNPKPDIVDDRTSFFVRCDECKPFSTVIYGEARHDIDHVESWTDEEADAKGEALVASIDWNALRQTAIDAWNRRAGDVSTTPIKIEG